MTFTWNEVLDESGIDHYRIEVHNITRDWEIGENRVGTTYPNSLRDGNYQWQVRAIDKAGNAGFFSDPFVLYIDTQILGPTACFDVTTDSPQVGTTANFDASCSDDNGESPISSYIWNFDGGNTVSGKTASHTYQSADEIL